MTIQLRNELLKMSGALLETPQIRMSAGHFELFDPVFNLLYHCVKLAPQSRDIRKPRQKLLIHLLNSTLSILRSALCADLRMDKVPFNC
jgi:hypothetical protein